MELIRQEKDTNWTAPWASTSLVSMHGHSLHCYCVLWLAVNFRGECAKSNSDEVLARHLLNGLRHPLGEDFSQPWNPKT